MEPRLCSLASGGAVCWLDSNSSVHSNPSRGSAQTRADSCGSFSCLERQGSKGQGTVSTVFTTHSATRRYPLRHPYQPSTLPPHLPYLPTMLAYKTYRYAAGGARYCTCTSPDKANTDRGYRSGPFLHVMQNPLSGLDKLTSAVADSRWFYSSSSIATRMDTLPISLIPQNVSKTAIG